MIYRALGAGVTGTAEVKSAMAHESGRRGISLSIYIVQLREQRVVVITTSVIRSDYQREAVMRRGWVPNRNAPGAEPTLCLHGHTYDNLNHLAAKKEYAICVVKCS